MPAAGLGDCSVVLYRQFQPFWTQDYAESIFCLYFPEMRRATYVSLVVCVFIWLNLFETIMISDFTCHIQLQFHIFPSRDVFSILCETENVICLSTFLFIT